MTQFPNESCGIWFRKCLEIRDACWISELSVNASSRKCLGKSAEYLGAISLTIGISTLFGL